jgi:hypothetical protein
MEKNGCYKCFEGIPIRSVDGWIYEIHEVQFTIADRLEFLTLYEDRNKLTKKYVCLLKLLYRRYNLWYIVSETYHANQVDIVIEEGGCKRSFSTSTLQCKL